MTQSVLNCAQRDQLRDLLLGPLHMHFLAAGQAYADYMDNGKSFLFACSLRRINESARELLLTHGHLLPKEMQPHAITLLRHYDVWLTLWDELAASMKPSLGQVFVFENPVQFPKDAQQALTQLYERIRG